VELLRRLEKETTDRVGVFLLLPFFGQAAVMVWLFVVTGREFVWVIVAGLVLSAALSMAAIATVGREIGRALARAAVVHAVFPRVVEFELREWRIVGSEQ